MKLNNKSFFNLSENTFKFLSFSLLIFYIFYNLKNNIYEVLFIDERLLIDDIYNVWLIDDIYNRFDNVSNQILKNFLILFVEFSYGGDLRFGRLWSNFFTIIAGPLTFISDTAVIIFSRIINSILFFYGAYLLSKQLLDKRYIWISVFTIYSFSQVEVLHRVPKPEPLVIIFVAIGISYFQKNKYYHSIFYLGIASFLKINAVIILGFIFILIFISTRLNKIELLIKSFFLTLLSLIMVNPILIIPPVKINSFEVPNFYKIYLNWITSQGSNSDQIVFSLEYAQGWVDKFTLFYKLPNSFVFIVMFSVIFYFAFKEIIKSKDNLSKCLLLIFCSYLFFYFFFLERVWTRYLHLPLALLLIAYLRTYSQNVKTFIPIITISLLGIVGNIENIDRYLNDTTFNMNDRLNYVGIDTQADAENLVNEVITEISLIYQDNPQLNKNIVYWHPDLITPRNKVTYNDTFYVREYWGDKNKANFALEDSDIFVTYTNYDVDSNISKKQINNLYIYFYTNLN